MLLLEVLSQFKLYRIQFIGHVLMAVVQMIYMWKIVLLAVLSQFQQQPFNTFPPFVYLCVCIPVYFGICVYHH